MKLANGETPHNRVISQIRTREILAFSRPKRCYVSVLTYG
jgi:hypothetical protein